jgi:tetratricopeptide (TPR) repeat protein
MGKKKDPGKRGVAGFVIGFFVVILAVGGGFFIVDYQKNAARYKQAIAISEFGPRKGVPKTIGDLERAIKVYQKQIDMYVRDAAQLGVYWKILGTRLSEKGMHIEAINAFQNAMRYNTDEAVLYYLTGVSEGRAAKGAASFAGGSEEVESYLELAESAYIHAIELDEQYTLALYGLAVLYAFELERPLDGMARIQRYMELRSGDVDAMFVLARCYYMAGQYQRAIDTYEQIMTTSRDKGRRDEAAANIRTVREVWNG